MRNFAEAGLMFDYICPKKDIETGLLWGIYEPEARGSHVGAHRTKSLVGLYISGALEVALDSSSMLEVQSYP